MGTRAALQLLSGVILLLYGASSHLNSLTTGEVWVANTIAAVGALLGLLELESCWKLLEARERQRLLPDQKARRGLR